MKKLSPPLSPNHYPLNESHFERPTVSSQDSRPDKSITTFDAILSKIKFGRYQLKVYFILGLVMINDGSEAVVLSVLQNILKTEWNLESAQNNVVGSAVFGGLLLGSMLAGKLSDQYGRKRPLTYLSILLYIVAMLCAFVPNFTALVIIRGLYGFLVGIQFPMCFTYLAEITPKEDRGLYLVLAGGFYTIGGLFTCFLSFLTLNGVSSGNWRLLLVGIAQPALLCWIFLHVSTYESPRYQIVTRGDIEGGIKILQDIATENDPNLIIEEEDVQGLTKWAQTYVDKDSTDVASISALFKPNTRVITILLWIIWFVICLSYYGMVYILPTIVEALNPEKSGQENTENLWSITLPCLGEIPSVLIGAWMVDKASFGRKKTMILGFATATMLCLLAVWVRPFIIWAVTIRMLMNGVFIILPPYTTELYPTQIRATGLGMASAFSRTGGALMTWFSQAFFDWFPTAPYLGFGILSLVACVCSSLIPYDTTKKELDIELPKVDDFADKQTVDENFEVL